MGSRPLVRGLSQPLRGSNAARLAWQHDGSMTSMSIGWGFSETLAGHEHFNLEWFLRPRTIPVIHRANLLLERVESLSNRIKQRKEVDEK